MLSRVVTLRHRDDRLLRATILTNNGFSTTAALNVSVALGATYLVMQIVGLSIVDRVGRRRLTLMIPGAAAGYLAAAGRTAPADGVSVGGSPNGLTA
jgi:hypothetical protein